MCAQTNRHTLQLALCGGGIYIYIYTRYEHEAIRLPKTENNIGAPSAPQKREMSRYLPESTKTGNFKQRRTLSGLFFVIPERLASIRAVVLAFAVNKQTTLNYIYI